MNKAEIHNTVAAPRFRREPGRRLVRQITRRYDLYLMLLIPVTWYLVFHYGPLYGLQIAFKNFNPGKGILGSSWVGFEHFQRFLTPIISGDFSGIRCPSTCSPC